MFPLADFLIYSFITAYTPGANNLLSMSNALRLGFRRSLRFLIGITLGFFGVMLVCTVCSTTFYVLLPRLMLAMKIAGCAYLLHLAWKVWRSGKVTAQTEEGASSLHAGLLLQFMNPKIYIYAFTAMSLYILPHYDSPAALAGFVLVLTAIGASASYIWALFGAVFCRLFERHAMLVNSIMALMLVYCALALFH